MLQPEDEPKAAELKRLLTLAEASELIPSSIPGKRVSTKTLSHWIADGKLRAVRRGRTLFTTVAWIDAMFHHVGTEPPPKVETPREQRERQQWSRKVLERAGIV